jgi:hypothetical protein
MLQFGCEADPKPTNYVEFLKDAGYKSLECSLSYNEDIQTFDLTAEVIPKSERVEMLLARCVNNLCDFEIIEESSVPTKILCQRFYNSEDFLSEFSLDQIILTYNTERFLDIKE